MNDEKAFWPGWNTVRELGSGSFGAVYEIERDVMGLKERSALKVITIPVNPADAEEMLSEGYDKEGISTYYDGMLRSIVQEYTTMAQLKGNSHVVSCEDVSYERHADGIGWDIKIRMELLTPIMKVLDRFEDPSEVVKLGTDICDALNLCRAHNIIHRDIKPQNIFLSESGDYKLGDFGIAKVSEGTSRGTKTGTVKFMAPEVYRNEEYGASVDICSLGLVLYWLTNNRRLPFQPQPPAIPTMRDEENALFQRMNGVPMPLPVNAQNAFGEVITMACAFRAQDRFGSPAAFANALRSTASAASSKPFSAPAAPVFVNDGLSTAPSTAAEEGTVGVHDLNRSVKPAPAAAAAPDPVGENTVNVFGTVPPQPAPETPQSRPVTPPQQTTYTPPQPNAPVYTPPQPVAQPFVQPAAEPKKKSKKWIIPVAIGGGLLLMCALAGGIYGAVNGARKKTKPYVPAYTTTTTAAAAQTLPAPTNFIAEESGNTFILRWDEEYLTDQFMITREINGEKAWYNVSGTDTSFTDTDAPHMPGTVVKYSIAGVDEAGNVGLPAWAVVRCAEDTAVDAGALPAPEEFYVMLKDAEHVIAYISDIPGADGFTFSVDGAGPESFVSWNFEKSDMRQLQYTDTAWLAEMEIDVGVIRDYSTLECTPYVYAADGSRTHSPNSNSLDLSSKDVVNCTYSGIEIFARKEGAGYRILWDIHLAGGYKFILERHSADGTFEEAITGPDTVIDNIDNYETLLDISANADPDDFYVFAPFLPVADEDHMMQFDEFVVPILAENGEEAAAAVTLPLPEDLFVTRTAERAYTFAVSVVDGADGYALRLLRGEDVPVVALVNAGDMKPIYTGRAFLGYTMTLDESFDLSGVTGFDASPLVIKDGNWCIANTDVLAIEVGSDHCAELNYSGAALSVKDVDGAFHVAIDPGLEGDFRFYLYRFTADGRPEVCMTGNDSYKQILEDGLTTLVDADAAGHESGVEYRYVPVFRPYDTDELVIPFDSVSAFAECTCP